MFDGLPQPRNAHWLQAPLAKSAAKSIALFAEFACCRHNSKCLDPFTKGSDLTQKVCYIQATVTTDSRRIARSFAFSGQAFKANLIYPPGDPLGFWTSDTCSQKNDLSCKSGKFIRTWGIRHSAKFCTFPPVCYPVVATDQKRKLRAGVVLYPKKNHAMVKQSINFDRASQSINAIRCHFTLLPLQIAASCYGS